jgi:hypothetical protein
MHGQHNIKIGAFVTHYTDSIPPGTSLRNFLENIFETCSTAVRKEGLKAALN